MIKKIERLPSPFKEVLKATSFFASSQGFGVFLVGGVVRDLILGRGVFDLDIVVEGDAIVLAKEVADHFKKAFRRHHSFGTATVYFGEHKIDFATARKEYYPQWGALPKVSPSSLEDDLLRRDFTINAMALSLNKLHYGEIVDLYGGLADLRNGSIRVLHKNSFLDDPTRILRAIRFEQRFSFKLEKNTFRWMKNAIASGALSCVHHHRWKDELILILKESNPYLSIKRIAYLAGFSFIHKDIKLKKDDFKFLLRIKKAIAFYERKFKKHKKLESWIVYLAALLIKLPKGKMWHFLNDFGLKKQERAIIISIKNRVSGMKKLNRSLRSHRVFRTLTQLSFESIVFFYAFYTDKKIRKNIEHFLDELVYIRLHIRGDDLEQLG
ncbi:MAG: CCA tRNA nucleotidyltransferase, partial [Candidatus Omnitrophota bacterium]